MAAIEKKQAKKNAKSGSSVVVYRNTRRRKAPVGDAKIQVYLGFSSSDEEDQEDDVVLGPEFDATSDTEEVPVAPAPPQSETQPSDPSREPEADVEIEEEPPEEADSDGEHGGYGWPKERPRTLSVRIGMRDRMNWAERQAPMIIVAWLSPHGALVKQRPSGPKVVTTAIGTFGRRCERSG